MAAPNTGAATKPELIIQKKLELFKKALGSRLLLEEQMIAAGQRLLRNTDGARHIAVRAPSCGRDESQPLATSKSRRDIACSSSEVIRAATAEVAHFCRP